VTGGKRSARSTVKAGRQLLRADGADRCDDRHGHQGRDLRPRRPALPVQGRGRGDQDGQGCPHPNPPPLAGEEREGQPPISTAATSAASGVTPRARIRHRRHQRGHHLDRDRPVRRHEGKRHRPIWWFTGARNTASRSSSKSNTSAWAAASTGKESCETGRPGSDRTA
jgi:hypothetical protein